MSVHYFNFRKNTVERFTCGDCHILAAELIKLIGGEICVFGGVGSEHFGNNHAFVRLADGTCVDITGTHSSKDLATAWGYKVNKIVAVSQDDLDYHWGGPQCYDEEFPAYSYQVARRVAKKIAKILTNK